MENIDSRIPSFGFCYCLLQRVDGSLADFCNTIGHERTSAKLAREATICNTVDVMEILKAHCRHKKEPQAGYALEVVGVCCLT
jgi:hypothetical protein